MKNIKVFVLDDDIDSVDRLVFLLERIDNISICGSETSSAAAVPLIKSNRPDIIFLDIEMPGSDGFKILESVREAGYAPEVIFVTGHDRYAIKAIRERAFDYLLKPVGMEELTATIERFRKSLEGSASFELVKGLSRREKEVFHLLRRGLTSREISEELNISKNTVDTHRRKILAKLKLCSTTQIHLNYPPEK